ncbi:MAG TPA: hypothetical protein VEB20_25260 [Azospirillaceae bacterium]|nr:hypothetical protein [Azospirillaceae bacterium]
MDTAAAVAAYFNRYSAAFAARDADAVRGLFDDPLSVLTAEKNLAYVGPQQLAAYVEGMLDTYRRIGLAWPVPAAVWTWPYGEDLVRAEILWLLRNDTRDEIARFSTGYLLRRASGDWKVATVVSYQEPAVLNAHFAEPAGA